MSNTEYLDWKWALGFYDGRTFAFLTQAGWGPAIVNDEAPPHFLPANILNRQLGEAAIVCLEKSRFLPKVDQL